MTGFTSIDYYAPSLVLLAGVFTIAGVLGIGNRIGHALRLPQPWRTTVGAIAALEILTLGVEGVAIANIATPGILIAVWSAFCVLGAALLRFRWENPLNRYTAAPAAVLIFNLLIALSPSTKGDELYYHMIVPSRIVLDGGLSFYRNPIVSAIYPQMAFQIGFAPFHAMHLPDAGNVVSWFFGALLIWFAYVIIEKSTGSRIWAAVFSAALLAGLYTSVWHVASGAHAIGDLAVAVSVVALYTSNDLREVAGTGRAAITVGILVAAFASTKVLFFPLAAAVVLVAAVRLGWKSLGWMAIAPVVFMVPLMIWTAAHSGSPLGPLLEGSTGPSAWPANEVRTFVLEYVAGPRGPIPEKLRNEAVNYSPVLWLSIAAFLLLRRHISVKPGVGVALLIVQIVVILGWNTYDARYLGGVHYALMILFAMFLFAAMRDNILARGWFRAVAALLIVPWMLLQIGYGSFLIKPVFHLESGEQFLTRYVPFYRDFVALDRVLPRDAILFSPLGFDSIYAPRPVYYHELDIPKQRPLFVFSYNGPAAGRLVYENRAAVMVTYRVPGRRPRFGDLRVTRVR